MSQFVFVEGNINTLDLTVTAVLVLGKKDGNSETKWSITGSNDIARCGKLE